VRLLLALDRKGALRFAPLGGELFRRLVPEAERAELPDSLVLLTVDGLLRVRSAAVLGGLRLAGGPARALAAVLEVVPRPLADRLYAGVAKVRRHLLAPPRDACPPVRPGLRERFLP
jgi:predicted DCC family thiol-disulfide oxidoreductase YuxK